MVTVDIKITFSKLIAILILIGSFVLDLTNNSVTATMFALPFVVTLITGKQFMDLKKDRL